MHKDEGVEKTFRVRCICPQRTRFSGSFCQRTCPSLLSQLFRLQSHCHRVSRSTLFVSCLKIVTLHRATSYVAPRLRITRTPGKCTLSLSSTQSSSRPLFSLLQPFADLRPHLSGALAEQFTGCLWDKIASKWSGTQEWIDKRRRSQSVVRKRDFVTFAMMSVKHSVAHRPQSGEILTPTKKGKSRGHWVHLTFRLPDAQKVLLHKSMET